MLFFIETFLLGLKNLRLHKLRSLLTALGIIFGVAAVIMMVAIGEGAKREANKQLELLGARNIIIRSVKPPENTSSSERTQRVLSYGLKRADEARLATLPGIHAIVPLRDTEQRIVVGDIQAVGSALGTTSAIFNVMRLPLAGSYGRYFTQTDEEERAPVCVLGATVATQLFPSQDPIGRSVQVGSTGGSGIILEVVGVLEPTNLRGEGARMMRNLDMDLYFPLTVAEAVFGDTIVRRQAGSMERKIIERSEIWLQAERAEDVEVMAAIAENMLSTDRLDTVDYQVEAPIEILRSAERVQRQFNIILVGIASFALVVGGIGIMNIMLASVTERTREIGIRRALGAKRKHITLQFLIETTLISLAGGLIGIGFGCGGAIALPIIVSAISGGGDAAYATSIAPWSVLGSFFVSGMIGVGFGLYPAVMAARMNPIEALRHE